MTPGEAVSRKQRGILDDTGHASVSVEESVQWHTITDARTTRYRPFGAPTSEPWQRRDDTPTYQGRHRRASYIPFLCSCRACRPVAS